MISELERVVLTADLSEHRLEQGDVGTVVLVHGEGKGYEVEFASLSGETVAVISVTADQVRRVRKGEIAHVRMVKA